MENVGVASPCIQICRIDLEREFCEGCRRTMEEIVAWPEMTDDERRRVLERTRSR